MKTDKQQKNIHYGYEMKFAQGQFLLTSTKLSLIHLLKIVHSKTKPI